MSPIVNAIETLESKVDLLDTRHQETARQIIIGYIEAVSFKKTVLIVVLTFVLALLVGMCTKNFYSARI